MKKTLLFLLLFPLLLLGQNPTAFPYGVKLTNTTSVTATKVNVQESDGKVNTMPMNSFFASHAAQSDTGVLSFAGLTTNSATTINIGAAYGYVVDNETNPTTPVSTLVNYVGASNVTVTTIGTGAVSYVMLSSAGVISFQNTFPTSAERKAKIWLGKVSHPAGAVTLVVNEPDYITSPLAFSRDWFQDLGPYVNNGVYPYANGANLNINVTGGTITGDGINFVNSKQDPNHIAVSAGIAQAFMIRTQTGLGGASTTLITPTVYDVAGTITAIPGSSNQATIQYIWCVPGQGYVVQLGQTLYGTFSLAVEALGKETSFTVYPNLPGNAIPIAALVVTKGCTALNDTGVTAQFFRANKNGDFFGASAGTSTATIQSAYNNSVQPVVTTNSTLGAFTFKRGSAADTDNIIVGQNGAGSTTFSVAGNGNTDISNGLLNTNIIGYAGTMPRVTFGLNSPTSLRINMPDVAGFQLRRLASSTGPQIRLGGSLGTFGTPTNTLSGNTVGTISFDAYTGGGTSGQTIENFTPVANIFAVATSNSSTTDSAGALIFRTVPAGSTTPVTRMQMFSSGEVMIGAVANSGDKLQVDGNISATSITTTVNTITITTAVSITTATTGTNSLGQNNRHVILDNGVNPINLTCNGGVTSSYGKVGTGAITFVQGSGRTLVQLSGTAVLNGAVGSTATLWSNGTTDYLSITNY